jgi:hypothetical protein
MDRGRLDSVQKENLVRPFTMEEAKTALKEMRTESSWI